MYTGDSTTTVSQENTKSTIQALLKNKEQRPIAIKPLPLDSNKDKGILINYTVASDLPDTGSSSQNFDFDIKSQASPDNISNSTNSQESLEYQKDFNYSQKLFHIADGNLYSIFSPIQGRSYGMKPSFLRKQKYTVQECHSRGRKHLRKGLKFHNFLPSESVTSEKDNGYLNAKWKVHSECRLREEHGTKQITISNWSQSIQKLPDELNNYTGKNSLQVPLPTVEACTTEPLSQSKCENKSLLDSQSKSDASDPYDFNLQQHISESPEINKIKTETAQDSLVSIHSKKDSLNFVLNSLIEKPLMLDNNSSCSDETNIQNKSFQKHRRKPIQTRRVVPYVKYLSIIEENESLPLDLSSKCLIENSSSYTTSYEDSQNLSGKCNLKSSSPPVCDKNPNSSSNFIVSSNENVCMPNVLNDKMMVNTLDGIMQTKTTSPVAVLYPLSFNKSGSLEQNGFHPIIQGSSNLKITSNQNMNQALPVPVDKPYNVVNQSVSNSANFSLQKSFVKEVQSKPRKRNQRSVIKQKLEDTFRQNGFLVKTKQVSDGEATFCKFRQLRKYTRYYLKSLEQHLPDEFHKMWKGFLPPKTVLPPVLATPDPQNES